MIVDSQLHSAVWTISQSYTTGQMRVTCDSTTKEAFDYLGKWSAHQSDYAVGDDVIDNIRNQANELNELASKLESMGKRANNGL